MGIGYGVTLFGGLALFAIELTTAQTPQPSFFIDQVDVQFTRLYWNQLESKAQVLSANPELAGTVFGRASRAGSDIYQRLPDWQDLVRDPLPQPAAQAGFSYVYMSEQWWKGLSASTQAIYLENPCVKTVKEISVKGGLLWRRLLDISACK